MFFIVRRVRVRTMESHQNPKLSPLEPHGEGMGLLGGNQSFTFLLRLWTVRLLKGSGERGECVRGLCFL